MSESANGRIGWTDLTVPNTEAVRDFYGRVAGWNFQPFDMGGYEDFIMLSQDGSGVAGICQPRGPNADLPPVWLVYINVPDLDTAVAEAVELGGSVISGPTGAVGEPRFAVLRDPTGAAFALAETPDSEPPSE
jgi:uncharacterized protein